MYYLYDYLHTDSGTFPSIYTCNKTIGI